MILTVCYQVLFYDTQHVITSKGGGNMILTVANRKGGTGKTAISYLLSFYLYAQGHKVLSVDLDSQGNLTNNFKRQSQTLDSFKAGELDAIFDRLHLLRASKGISQLNSELQHEIDRNGWIKKTLLRDYIKQYDFILLDTSPSLDPVNISALAGSDLVLIVVDPDENSIKGLNEMHGIIDQLKALNPEITKKIVLNKHNKRSSFIRDYCLPLLQQDPDFIGTIPERAIFKDNALGSPEALDNPEIENAFKKIYEGINYVKV